MRRQANSRFLTDCYRCCKSGHTGKQYGRIADNGCPAALCQISGAMTPSIGLAAQKRRNLQLVVVDRWLQPARAGRADPGPAGPDAGPAPAWHTRTPAPAARGLRPSRPAATRIHAARLGLSRGRIGRQPLSTLRPVDRRAAWAAALRVALRGGQARPKPGAGATTGAASPRCSVSAARRARISFCAGNGRSSIRGMRGGASAAAPPPAG